MIMPLWVKFQHHFVGGPTQFRPTLTTAVLYNDFVVLALLRYMLTMRQMVSDDNSTKLELMAPSLY